MKFSIRDLLLVTVIVALAVAWWMDRNAQLKQANQWRGRAEDLARFVEANGIGVTWDRDGVGYSPRTGKPTVMTWPAPTPPPKAPKN